MKNILCDIDTEIRIAYTEVYREVDKNRRIYLGGIVHGLQLARHMAQNRIYSIIKKRKTRRGNRRIKP